MSIIRFAAAWAVFKSLDWWAPALAGSAMVGFAATLAYLLAVRGTQGLAKFALLRDVAGSARSLTVGLGRGTAVRFQVQAINAVGTSPISAHSNGVVVR